MEVKQIKEMESKPINSNNNIETLEQYARMAQVVDKLEKEFNILADTHLKEQAKKNFLIRTFTKYWKQSVLVISILIFVIPKTIEWSIQYNEMYHRLILNINEFNEKIDNLVKFEEEKINKEQEKINKSNEQIEILKEILKVLKEDEKDISSK